MRKFTPPKPKEPDMSIRTLKTKNILWLTLGTLVGAGLVSLSGVAADLTGYSIWLAYIVAVILGFLASIPYFLASRALVLDGGMYTMNALLGHPIIGGLQMMSIFPGIIGQSTVALSIGLYLQVLVPSIPVRIAATLATLVIYYFNIKGIDAINKIQEYMMYLLLGGLLLFSVYCFKNFNIEAINFSGPEFFKKGSSGFVMAVSLLSFSTQSYSNVLSMSKFTENPKDSIYKGMVRCLPLLFLIYGGVTLAAVGAKDLNLFAGNTLGDVAKEIMPQGIFFVFMIACPLMALLTTLNGNLAGLSMMAEPAAADGWMPRLMTKKNKHNMPFIIQTIFTVIIIIPIALGLNIKFITSNVVLLMNFINLTSFYSVYRMPKYFPEIFKNIPGNMTTSKFYILLTLGLIARLVLTYFSLISLSGLNLIINILVFAIIVICAFVLYNSNKTSESIEYSVY